MENTGRHVVLVVQRHVEGGWVAYPSGVVLGVAPVADRAVAVQRACALALHAVANRIERGDLGALEPELKVTIELVASDAPYTPPPRRRAP